MLGWEHGLLQRTLFDQSAENLETGECRQSDFSFHTTGRIKAFERVEPGKSEKGDVRWVSVLNIEYRFLSGWFFRVFLVEPHSQDREHSRLRPSNGDKAIVQYSPANITRFQEGYIKLIDIPNCLLGWVGFVNASIIEMPTMRKWDDIDEWKSEIESAVQDALDSVNEDKVLSRNERNETSKRLESIEDFIKELKEREEITAENQKQIQKDIDALRKQLYFLTKRQFRQSLAARMGAWAVESDNIAKIWRAGKTIYALVSGDSTPLLTDNKSS